MKRQQKELSTIAIFFLSGLIAAVLFGILWALQPFFVPAEDGHDGSNVPSEEQMVLMPTNEQLEDVTRAAFFIENMGQAPEDIAYYINVVSGDAMFRDGRVTFQHSERITTSSIRHIGYDMVFAGVDTDVLAVPQAIGQTETTMNHFVGDLSLSDIPTYKELEYPSLYDGVDLVFYLQGVHVKYDYRVAPFADPSPIAFAFEGVDDISLSETGDLVLTISDRAFVHDAPRTYQEIEGNIVEVDSAYELTDDGLVRFTLGAYDESYALIIDPTLENLQASSYLGGSGADLIYGMTLDASGNVIAVGRTTSSNFDTTGGYDTTQNGNEDAFVARMNANLTSYLSGTYLGGSLDDEAFTVVVDGSGAIYVAGLTHSTNFPTTAGAFDETENGNNVTFFDAFISKFNSDLSALSSSTYFGSTSFDQIRDMQFHPSNGMLYVAGITTGGIYTNGNEYDTVGGLNNEGFVSIFNQDLSSVASTTLIGKDSSEGIYAFDFDASNNVYVVGYANGADFPTTTPTYDGSYNGSTDLIVAAFDQGLENLLYSTYLGSSGDEDGGDIAIDSSGNVYVVGYTDGATFPTSSSAYDGTHNGGGDDVFVSKLNAALTSLVASTFVGGSGVDKGNALVLDSNNYPYITGYTASTDFPTSTGAYAGSNAGGNDVFVTKLSADLSSLSASTYIGGASGDEGEAIALNTSLNRVYIGAHGQSSGYPTTTGAFDTLRTGFEGYVSAFDYELESSSPPTAPGNLTVNTTNTTDVILNFGAASTDDNFSEYRLFYKLGASTVTTTDIAFTTSSDPGDANLTAINYSGASTTTITGLSTSTQYVVNIWAYDESGFNTPAASELAFYTLADVPGAPTTTAVSTTSVQLTINTSTNPTDVEFTLCQTTDGLSCASGGYVQTNGTLDSTAVWATSSVWGGTGGLTLTGLSVNTSYRFIAQARNGDNVETAYSADSGALATLTTAPTGVSASLSGNDVTASWSGNGTEYFADIGGNTSGWTTDTSYTAASLTCGASYVVSVKARNADTVETSEVTTGIETADCGGTDGGGGVSPVIITPQPVPGCTDPTAQNFSPIATTDDGSCTYPVAGCTDELAENHNPAATTDDGSCTYPDEDVSGCTDADAENYNPAATVDDGSCTYPDDPINGCTDASATNYNAAATADDGSCTYEEDIAGCTDASAQNYNSAATVDDGSCTYPDDPINGCTDASATNYNAAATADDGTCTYDAGCVGDECDPVGCVGSDCAPAIDNNTDNGGGEVIASVDTGIPFVEETTQVVKDVSVAATEVIQETVQVITSVATEAIEAVVVFADNPVVEETNEKVVAPVVVAAGAANVALGFSLPQVVAFLKYFFSQPLLLLRRRKQKEWGVIYNAFTKRPVDLATIRVFDAESGNIVRSQVTDSKGRYFLMLDPGKYRIEIDKTGFGKSSEHLHGKAEDSTYSNLYHAGEEVEVTEEQSALNVNIPLDPAIQDKSARYIVKDHVTKAAQFLMSMIGLGVSAVSFMISPNPFIGGLLGLHILFYAMFHILAHKKQPGAVGVIRDASNDKTLKNVAVRIFDAAYDKLIDTAVTDRKGRYAALVGPSTYYVTYEKLGYDKKKSDKIDFSSEATEGLGGVIAENEELDPASGGGGGERSDNTSAAQQDNVEVESTVKDTVKRSGKIEEDDIDKLKEIAQYGGKDS